MLPSIGSGNVSVTGAGTAANPFLATFQGAKAATDMSQITGSGGGLLGTGLGSVATITDGHGVLNEVQRITFDGEGLFSVTFRSAQIAIEESSTAAEVQGRLESLSTDG